MPLPSIANIMFGEQNMYEFIETFPYWLQISLLLVPVLSLLIAACVFAVNVWQTSLSGRNDHLQRAKIVSDAISSFMSDDIMRHVFYKIEYGEFEYHEDFHDSIEEKETDKLMMHFSNLAIMWNNDLLDLKDLEPLRYFICRTVHDSEIEKYMDFLLKIWLDKSGTGAGVHPYGLLRELVESWKNQTKIQQKGDDIK